MQYALVQDSDYSSFPLDPEKKWLALEEVCRKNLNELITHSNDMAADKLLRLQYMNIISAAAEELQIMGIDVPVTESNFDHFFMAVTRISTRLRLKSSSSNHSLSVAITRPTKSKIFSQIERLRKLILDSDFSDKKKKQLHSKLDELHAVVIAPRSDFGSIMAIIAYVAVGAGGTTSFLAEFPDALATISALVGEAKETEEEDHRQIEAEKKPIAIPDMREERSNDDEIPF